MSPLRWLLAFPFLAALALMIAGGCNPSPGDSEEDVSAGGLALTADAVALEVTGLPASLPAGSPGAMTVRAVNAQGATAAQYTGAVHFTASSPSTVLPADYTFQPADAGVHAFSFIVVVAGTETLTVTDTSVGTITGSGVATVTASGTSTITAPATVTAGEAGLAASATSWSGATFTWYVWNGTINAGQGTRAISFTAGSTGTLTLDVIAKKGNTLRTGTRSVVVAPVPQTPTITAATAVSPFSTGNTAWVTAVAGMKYTWTLTRATITSSGGAAGVTSNGLNRITYTSQLTSPVVLSVVEKNDANDASAPATVSIPVVSNAPKTPTITAGSPVTEGTPGLTAQVTARTGMGYAWTLSNGTITSPGGASGVTALGKNTITYTAGLAGTIALTCRETNGPYFSAPALSSVTVLSAPAPSGSLYFAAHQDDDLLFFNPDLERSIRSGAPTRTVFVTAGDPGTCPECWQARENGIWNAYSAMANVAKDWTCGPRSYGGKAVSFCQLNPAPNVSVMFMRLPDGGLASLWATQVGPPFWTSPVTSLTSVDNSYSVTHDDLVALMTDIVQDFRPAVIGTQDGTLSYGEEHPDHIASSLFALDMSHRLSYPVTLRIHRGYTTYGSWYTIPSPEPENLSLAEYAEKVRIMEAYGGGFPVDSAFDRWCHRQYAISSVVSGHGPLVSPSGQCLDTQGGAGLSDTPIEMRACDNSVAQSWTLTPDGKLLRATGRCLAISGSAAVLADCAATPSQRVRVFRNGQIRLSGGACLTVGWDGVSVGASDCDADRSTEKYVPIASQRFVQAFGPSGRWSQSSDFSDTDVGASASYYATFDLGRADANGRADAFVRRAGGAAWALGSGSAFAALTGTSGAFADADGWLPEAYGTTVQLGDVNGDGRADVCGRSAVGIRCAITSANGALGQVTAWSADFGDGQFGGAAYSPSVRLGDIDGDGYADVCGRASTGILCAKNGRAGTFDAATTWLDGDFTDADGYGAASSAGTLRLADVNGDGKADVCMRGSAGVRCAISNGVSAFTDAHLWSFRAELSDAEGWSASADRYASIDLADVNGDGRADLCGRSAGGLSCATSTGAAFEGLALVDPSEYSDSLGWAAAKYGGTLRLGDLNGDGRADVCGRDAGGLTCAIAP
ncbi:MAG: FG-GAP-like repeat-containing protein [Polyangiaceae bacterium]